MRKMHYGAWTALVVMSVCGCGDDDAPATTGTGGSSTAMGGSGGSAGVSGSGSGGERPSFGGSGGSGGDSGSGAGSAGSDSVDAGGNPSGSSDAGTVQSCLSLPSACLEFRGHRPICQESNAPNCMNLLGGEYIEGPCPENFIFVEVEETGCGPSATFMSPQACCDSPRFGPGLCPSCPPE
jgi:hypothetical protein